MSTSELEEIAEIAEILRNARTTRTPIPPPTKTYPTLNSETALQVQQITACHAIARGDRLVGYKLGNIAKVMQEAFGVSSPDYGFLLSSLFRYEGTKIPLSDFISPHIELEPAFVLKRKLKGPNATIVDVINAVDYCLPAVEIIDSRVKDWDIGHADTLADNGSTGAVILGGTPRRITELGLSDTRGALRFNGTEVVEGNTRNILGNPLAATAWLVNRLAEYDIEFLPGQVVMPGSCLRALPMKEKGHWSCSFDGFGTVEFEVV